MGISILHQANSTLGEGPLWDPRAQSIYWIDIRRQRIQCFDPFTGKQTGIWVAKNRLGCIGLTNDKNKLLVADGGEIRVLDLQSGHSKLLTTLPIDFPTYRANDGRIDVAGRLWVGTMLDDFFNPKDFRQGALYSVSPDGEVVDHQIEFYLPNGIGWSPDGKTAYLNDTVALKTYRFSFNPEAGTLSNQEVHYDHSSGEGFPDGLCIDTAGCIWSAQWDGWNVRRISSEGELLEELKVPVRRPTGLVFFGPNLNRLAMTSATVDFSSDDFIKSPNAGAVFELPTSSNGLTENTFSIQ